jgi:hypothetical protein
MAVDDEFVLDNSFQDIWDNAGASATDQDPETDEPIEQEGAESDANDGTEPQDTGTDTQDDEESDGAEDDPARAVASQTPQGQTQEGATETEEEIPLAPVTYRVDGEERTIEGLHAVGDDGAIIDKEALPAILQRLSERDHYFTKSQQQYRQYHDLEQLTAWKTVGPDGTETTLTGPEAIEALRVSHGQLTAAVQALGAILDDPNQLVSLLQQDEHGNVVINQERVDHLATKIRLASLDAERSVRGSFADQRRSATQAIEQQQFQAQLPGQLWTQADREWGKDFPALTDDDKGVLQQQLPRYLRPPTAEEIQSGQFQPNARVLDYSFHDLMAHLAKQRADSAKVATTTTQAAKDNAARLAATGRRAPQSKSLPPRDRQTGRFTEQTGPKQPRVTDLLRNGQFPDFASARAI